MLVNNYDGICDNNPSSTDLCPVSTSPYMEGVGLMEDSLEDKPDCFLNLSTAKGPGLGGSVSVMYSEGAALPGLDLLCGREPDAGECHIDVTDACHYH